MNSSSWLKQRETQLAQNWQTNAKTYTESFFRPQKPSFAFLIQNLKPISLKNHCYSENEGSACTAERCLIYAWKTKQNIFLLSEDKQKLRFSVVVAFDCYDVILTMFTRMCNVLLLKFGFAVSTKMTVRHMRPQVLLFAYLTERKHFEIVVTYRQLQKPWMMSRIA